MSVEGGGDAGGPSVFDKETRRKPRALAAEAYGDGIGFARLRNALAGCEKGFGRCKGRPRGSP